MNYNSFFFLWIFPIVFATYWFTMRVAPTNIKIRTGNICLLVLSYLILAHENILSCIWLAYVTAVSFFGAKQISSRRLPLFSVIALAILPLTFTKYYGFVCLMLQDIGFSCKSHSFVVPIGISFFTLQAIGYITDVSRKTIEPERSLLNHSLFLSFFPQIVSGPISRYSQLMPQIRGQRTFNEAQATEGLRMLLWGMFLKVVIADRLALTVNDMVDHLEASDGSALLSMAFQYSAQIYSDFAGYSLMAIGAAKVMGFDLPDNFRRPYLSTSITDFWHRWHISLSLWLRDYVYISLGGNRCSKWRNYINTVVTFVVSGLWHGANYTFIVWGVLHGVIICIEKRLGLNKYNIKGGFVKAFRIGVTFCIVSMLWVIFRMSTLSDAYEVFIKIFTCSEFHLILPEKYVLALIMIAIAKDVVDEYRPQYCLFNNKRRLVRWSAYVFIATMIILVGVFDTGQFIYAKF